MREWSRLDPSRAPALRGRALSSRDEALLAQLAERTSLRVESHRDGLHLRVGPHIGALPIAGLNVLILPKLPIAQLMRVIAYALDLAPWMHAELSATLATTHDAGTDLLSVLALCYLNAAEHIWRQGLVPRYVEETDLLTSPRGRIDLRHWLTQPPSPTPQVRCHAQALSLNHDLNLALIAGLRWLAPRLTRRPLSHRLRLTADRIAAASAASSSSPQPTPHLTKPLLDAALAAIDRRSSHYRPALQLLAWLYQSGAHATPALSEGALPVGAFLLDMNLIFERFLTRYLTAHAPPGFSIQSQQSLRDVFSYLQNPAGWQRPRVRPDLILCHHGQPVAIADAKYRDRHDHPPSTQELYQLTTYGLSYPLPAPRVVLLLHPLADATADHPSTLRFAPPAQPQSVVEIRLVGVPLSTLTDPASPPWWPLA